MFLQRKNPAFAGRGGGQMNLPLISAIGAVVFATIALAVLGAVLQKAIYDAEPLYAVLSVVLLVALIGGALRLDRGQRRDRE